MLSRFPLADVTSTKKNSGSLWLPHLMAVPGGKVVSTWLGKWGSTWNSPQCMQFMGKMRWKTQLKRWILQCPSVPYAGSIQKLPVQEGFIMMLCSASVHTWVPPGILGLVWYHSLVIRLSFLASNNQKARRNSNGQVYPTLCVYIYIYINVYIYICVCERERECGHIYIYYTHIMRTRFSQFNAIKNYIKTMH